jgi:hypothetical protein
MMKAVYPCGFGMEILFNKKNTPRGKGYDQRASDVNDPLG